MSHITVCIDTFEHDDISGCYPVEHDDCTTGVTDELGNCAPVGVEPLDPFTPYWEQEGVCLEDMDCWDCTTMGNQVCGPTTTAVVAVAEPPVPYLPDTGTASGGIAALGAILIFLGIQLTFTARRKS